MEAQSPEFSTFTKTHSVTPIIATRAIITVDIHQVGISCGYSVPFYDFVGFRSTLNDHFAKKDEKFKQGEDTQSIERYWAHKNAWSMDGLPANKTGLKTAREKGVEPIKKMVGPLAPKSYKNASGVRLEYVLLVAVMSFLLGALVMVYGREVVPIFDRGGAGGYVNVSGISMGSLPLVGHSKR